MDGALALGGLRPRSRDCICNGRASQLAAHRLGPRCADLADELWNNRKRAFDRDRSALRFTLRPGDHFLAKLLGTEQIAVARLDSSIHFSRARLARERPDASPIFLRHRALCGLAGERCASVFSSRTSGRHRSDARCLCGMGRSFCSKCDREVGDVQVVKAILRPAERRGFQIFQLDPQCSAQPRLFSAVASFVTMPGEREIFV